MNLRKLINMKLELSTQNMKKKFTCVINLSLSSSKLNRGKVNQLEEEVIDFLDRKTGRRTSLSDARRFGPVGRRGGTKKD